jgi:hypothetical protein
VVTPAPFGDISVPSCNSPWAQGLSAGSGQFRRLDVAYSNDTVVEPDILAARQYLGGHGQYSQGNINNLDGEFAVLSPPKGHLGAPAQLPVARPALITDATPIGALCCA